MAELWEKAGDERDAPGLSRNVCRLGSNCDCLRLSNSLSDSTVAERPPPDVRVTAEISRERSFAPKLLRRSRPQITLARHRYYLRAGRPISSSPALSTRDTLPPQVPPFVATDRTICSDCVSWPSQLAMAVTVDARLPLMTATRRLTAIISADVAGYSRLMGADEEVRLAGDPHQRGSVLAEVHPGATHHVRVAGWKLASAPLLQRRRRHRAQFEHELLR